MAQAVAAARGEWLLATDADMIFAPRAVRTVLDYAQANDYDAVTLLPRIVCGSFWERVFLPAFGWFMLLAMPARRVNNPQRKEAAGVGQPPRLVNSHQHVGIFSPVGEVLLDLLGRHKPQAYVRRVREPWGLLWRIKGARKKRAFLNLPESTPGRNTKC